MLAEAAMTHGLADVAVTGTTCLGPCESGPIVVYPEGVWYGQLTPDNVNEVIEKHMVGGEPVERLMLQWPGVPAD